MPVGTLLWSVRPEILRQAKQVFEALPGLNHFTVLDPLFDADSAMVGRIAELARG